MATAAVMKSSTTTRSAPGRTVELAFNRRDVWAAVGFVALHVPLAVASRRIPGVVTAHAILCVLGSLIYAATTRRIRTLPIVASYIVGCEVLWRMNHAAIFWEVAKYAIIGMFLIGLVRIRIRRFQPLAILYFVLLAPSALLSFFLFDLDVARQEVSFYLAGPLALAVSVVFLSNVKLTANQLSATFIAMIAPVVGICTVSLIATVSQDELFFINGASFVVSGGFGPNQVSAMLGLGVMLLLLLIVQRPLPWWIRLGAFGVATILAIQSALTFSRGGVMLALAGLCGAGLFLMRNSRARIGIALVATIGFLLGNYVIEPKLEEVTNGKLSVRYESTKSSGRDAFVSSELELFRENIVMGVGPGGGAQARKERGEIFGASHTEYSRMLAEHGLLGVFSLCCFLLLCYGAVRHAGPGMRPFATACVIWAVLFFLIYGTRIAAPSLLFGLAFLRLDHNAPTEAKV